MPWIVISGCASTHSLEETKEHDLQAYVANLAGAADPGTTITTVNLTTNQERTITTGTEPSAFAVAPDGSTVYVANRGSDTVSVIDAYTDKVTSTIKVGLEPDAVATSSNGAFIVVANLDDNNINIVNTRTNQVVTTVSTLQEPDAVAVTPNNHYAYVADFGANKVTVVRINSNLTARSVISIPVGIEPDAVAISPQGTTVYVGNFGSNSITSIPLTGSNGENLACGPLDDPCRSIPAGRDPTNIAFSLNGETAYVTGGDSLTLISVSRASPSVSIPLGETAEAVALSSNGKMAYIADEQGYITPINLRSEKPTKPIPVGGHPVAIAVTLLGRGTG
ncbi:MAG: YncE family protein [Actinobacteria bacterium]|nr:YncE family protein [Actinomycetota bacterium]